MPRDLRFPPTSRKHKDFGGDTHTDRPLRNVSSHFHTRCSAHIKGESFRHGKVLPYDFVASLSHTSYSYLQTHLSPSFCLQQHTFTDRNKQAKKKETKMSSSGTSPSSSTSSEDDRKFMTRILKTIETVQAWDDDPTLLQECRWQIPWDELRGEGESSPYIRHEEDYHLSGNALLLQRLCRYFKQTMTWINSPECVNCGNKQCTYNTTRGPETQEEREGNASRVEGKRNNNFRNLLGNKTIPIPS